MKKIVKLLSCLIPIKSWRKKFRAKFAEQKHLELPSVNSQYYGKIYMPYYPEVKFKNDRPEIYNKEGQKMDVFFIRDQAGCHCPYVDSSKYFLWDRFNIGLDTHFYTHGAILETMGNPDKRYALFQESESIIPEQYKIFETHKGIERDFDKVITYSEKLLNTLDNAILFPACASVWYTKEIYNGIKDPTELDENLYKKKTKDISMICSAKKRTPMQLIRHRIANDALMTGKVDMYGGFKDGKMFPYKSTTLTDYRFQIVVENDLTPYYFTEKIMDCFMSMTIPVYLGASKIGQFFNEDGIIKIDKDCDIERVLTKCTKEEYEQRQSAVIENYKKSLKYFNLNDYLYETLFIGGEK